MNRRAAAAGTVLFAATVPATVAGLTPWWLAGRPYVSPSEAPTGARIAGATLVVGGTLLVGASFVRFVRARGTPAPIAETETLVATGPYRFTRNPQYVGVVAVAAGQACWWWSRSAAIYTAALGVVFHAFVRRYEEPRLRSRFPAEYQRMTAQVPRWLPRPRLRRDR